MSTNNKKTFKKFNNLKQVGSCYHKSFLQHKLDLTTLFLARFHAIINHFTMCNLGFKLSVHCLLVNKLVTKHHTHSRLLVAAARFGPFV